MAQAIILFFLLLFCLMLRLEGKPRDFSFSPLKISLVPWVLIYILHISTLLRAGYYHLDAVPVLFISTNVLLFALPLLVSSRRRIRPRLQFMQTLQNRNKNHTKRINRLLLLMLVLALVGTTLDTIGKFTVYGLDLSLNLSEQRTIINSWGTLDIERPLFMKIGLLISKFWGPALVVSLLFFERLTPLNRRLSLVNVLCPIVLSLTYLGRGAIVLMLWMVLVGVLLRRSFGMPMLPRFIVFKSYVRIMIAGMIFLIGYIFVVRTPFGHRVLVEHIQFAFIVKMGPALSSVLDSLPQPLMLVSLLTIYYFASPMYHFSFFWSYTMSGPYYGFGLLLPPMITSQLTKLDLNPFINVREILEAQYALYALPFRVFRTGFAALIYDLGIYGTFIFTALAGIYFAYRYSKLRRYPTLGNCLPIIIFSAYAIHGVMQNFLIMQDAFFVTIYTFMVGWYIRRKCDLPMLESIPSGGRTNGTPGKEKRVLVAA